MQVLAMWKRRRTEKRKESTLVRTGSWKAIIDDVEARHPGESRSLYRARLKEAWLTAAALVCSAFDRATARQQQKMLLAFNVYSAMAQQQAAEPAYCPSMDSIHGEFWMPSRILSYVDTVVTGIDDFFICRRVRCMSFCYSTQWIEGSSHYRCPACAGLYKPWASAVKGGQGEQSGSETVAAQKIMVCHTAEPLPGLSLKPGEVRYYLLEWADSKTEKLKDMLRETFCSVAQETAHVDEGQLLERVRDMVDRGKGASYFQDMLAPQWVKDRIDHANATATEQFSYAHIAGGYKGAFASPNLTILTQEESVRMWAYSKYAVESRIQRHASRM